MPALSGHWPASAAVLVHAWLTQVSLAAELQATQAAPPLPQLDWELPGAQSTVLPELMQQPLVQVVASQTQVPFTHLVLVLQAGEHAAPPPPPPAPPPPPPAPPPVWQMPAVQTSLPTQALQATPCEPQSVLVPGSIHLPPVLQQPLQFAGLHLAGPHDGKMAMPKPITAPSASAL